MSTEIQAWFAGRLPDEWFTEPAEVIVDREEISVVGTLPAPEAGAADEGARAAPRRSRAAAEGRIKRFREQTRDQRIEIAREAEHRFRRKVAWGARCAGHEEMFTTLSVPVMTRLRQSERRVLDTLVDAGRRPQPVRRARLVRAADRRARRRVAGRAPRRAPPGRGGAVPGAGRLAGDRNLSR